MMPKLKMFCSNLFVESSSKLVRVLRVRHFPPRSSFFFVAPPFVISYLIYDSAEKVIFSSQVFGRVITSTSKLGLSWDWKIERDNDRCKYMQNNYTPTTIYIIVIVLIDQTNNHINCPKNRSTRDCQGSSLESSTTRRKRWTREKRPILSPAVVNT